MVGAACESLGGLAPLPEVLVLTLAVAPTALLAALRPSFRLTPEDALETAGSMSSIKVDANTRDEELDRFLVR